MRKLFSVLVTLAVAASPLAAQARPDFSGKWALDATSIQQGVTSLTLTIKQDAKTLTVDTDAVTAMGNQKVSSVFNLDGTDSKNSVSGPMGTIETTSTVTWAGDTLAVTTKADIQGQSMLQTEKWTLGADKKTMMLDRSVAVAGQSMAFKLAFNKQ